MCVWNKHQISLFAFDETNSKEKLEDKCEMTDFQSNISDIAILISQHITRAVILYFSDIFRWKRMSSTPNKLLFLDSKKKLGTRAWCWYCVWNSKWGSSKKKRNKKKFITSFSCQINWKHYIWWQLTHTHTHTNPRMKTSIDELEGNEATIENVKDVSISIFN